MTNRPAVIRQREASGLFKAAKEAGYGRVKITVQLTNGNLIECIASNGPDSDAAETNEKEVKL